MGNDVYLGDGVYLSHDGYQLWLAVGNHQNKVVALELDVFLSLKDMGEEMFRQIYHGPVKEGQYDNE